MAFRLGTVIPSLVDGTSFYRGAGPLAAMQIEGNLSVDHAGRIDWVWMRGVEVLFMQRPFTPDHVRIMALAKLHGKPVWIDYDDDLFTVPASNPTHAVYRETGIHNNIMTLLTQADIVTCSTEALKTKFTRIMERVKEAGEMNDTVPHKNFDPEKFKVVPNAYDAELLWYSGRDWHNPLPPATKTVMWRGSNTHDADLQLFTDEIARAFMKHGAGWTLNFVGNPFWQSIERIEAAGVSSERVIITAATDPIEFFQYIFHIQPAVMIVPLVDDLFNRSKSNIAWIEASHAGAMTLAPDWPEWQRPGVINYSSPKDFEEKLGLILAGSFDRDELVRQSREYIQQHLSLDQVNRSRWMIIESLHCKDIWA